MKTAKKTIIALSLLITVVLGFYFYKVYNVEEIQDTLTLSVVEGDQSYATDLQLSGRAELENHYTGRFTVSEQKFRIPRESGPRSMYIPNDQELLDMIKKYPRFYRGKMDTYSLRQSNQWIFYSGDYFIAFDKETKKTIELPVSALNKESKDIINGTVTIKSEDPIGYISLGDVVIQGDIAIMSYVVSTVSGNFSSIIQYNLASGEQIHGLPLPSPQVADGDFSQSNMHILSENEAIFVHLWQSSESYSMAEEVSAEVQSEHYKLFYQYVNFENQTVEDVPVPETLQDSTGAVVVVDGTIHLLTAAAGELADHAYDLETKSEVPVQTYEVNNTRFDLMSDVLTEVKEDGTVNIAESSLGGEKKESGVVVLDLINNEKVMEGIVTHEGNQLSYVYFDKFE